MTHDAVQRWLDAYVDAWRTYDPAAIGALFAEDATWEEVADYAIEWAEEKATQPAA